MNESISERAAKPSGRRIARFGLRDAAAEITIGSLVQTLVRGWWLLLATILLAVLVTTVGLKLKKPIYSATMIVTAAPTDLTAASQLATELEEFASLATLAQSPIKLERVSNLERYIQLLASPALVARLQAEHRLLQDVFVDDWDPQSETWRRPQGVLASLEEAVLGFFGFPSWVEPDVAQLTDWLNRRISVGRLGGGSILRIKMDHPKPEFAVAVIEMLHSTADRMLREQELARINSEIAQVESELAAASAPTRRQALEDVVRDQYQVQTLLRADQPYAAQIMVPATASSAPTSANPLLVLVLAVMVGAIVGIFVIFLRDAWR